MNEEQREEIERRISKSLTKLYIDGYLECGTDRMLANIEVVMADLFIEILKDYLAGKI